MMDTRRAFQLYIMHQLELMNENGATNLNKGQMLEVIMEIEDDPFFHDKVSEILEDIVHDMESDGAI